MIYKQPTIYKQGNNNKLSLNLNDYSFKDVLDEIVFYNNFSRRGDSSEYARYYKDLGLLALNIFCCCSNTIPVALPDTAWLKILTLNDNDFYFSDFQDASQKPSGVLGMFSSSLVSQSIIYVNSYQTSNNGISVNTFVNEGFIGMKNMIDPDSSCRGVVLSRSFVVKEK